MGVVPTTFAHEKLAEVAVIAVLLNTGSGQVGMKSTKKLSMKTSGPTRKRQEFKNDIVPDVGSVEVNKFIFKGSRRADA